MAEIKIYGKPIHLFRYRSLGKNCEQEIDAIQSNYIYCSTYSKMNDPMEGAYDEDRITSIISNRFENKELIKLQISRIGIASFSETYDHETMWAHYADRFQGICVQYNFNSLLRGLEENIEFARMMYSEHAPVLNIDSYDIEEKSKNCLSSKTIKWSGEREWRMFSPSPGKISIRRNNPISKIYLGAKINTHDERQILEIGRELGIQISKMNLKKYSIDFKPIK